VTRFERNWNNAVAEIDSKHYRRVMGPDGMIELRKPHTAALLAWLVPGLGHLYQRRTAKGILFATCVLGTFFYGLFLGGGRVVYASWRPTDRRPQFICQLGAGVVAMPALIQAYRVKNDKEPLFHGLMAPPTVAGMGTPERPTLNDLHYTFNRRFELGTLFTMIAGLLNILAVYDAWGGPSLADEELDRPPPDEDPDPDVKDPPE
jgi:hypothetical protein